MSDPVKTVRHRQLRSGSYERGRDQEDRRADRAITVVVGILRRSLLRCLGGNDDLMSRAEREVIANNSAIEIDVAERDGDLQQKRCKREICAAPSMAVNPSHIAMVML